MNQEVLKIFSIYFKKDIDPSMSFNDLGGDSLDATNLSLQLLKDLRVKVHFSKIIELDSIDSILKYIESI